MCTCLENVDNPLVLHSLQNTAKCDEYSSSTHSGTEKESWCDQLHNLNICLQHVGP